MLIKRSKAEFIGVIEDEHKLDDEGTRKVMKRAEKELSLAEAELKQATVEN